jgi:hypothetical protein
MKSLYTSIVILALSHAGLAQAGIISLDYSNILDNQLADPASNFHPQGLGYDTGSNELLFMQQSSSTIYRTDLNGNINGSRSVGLNYTTSVAGDGTNYYVSDYTGNSSLADIWSIGKNAGTTINISSEVAAYGGYPIDVRDGFLYRAENTNAYDWSNLSQIRISNLASVDSILHTVALDTIGGIGDIAIDSARNQVWTIDFSSAAFLRQFDLSTGVELASFDLSLDGLTAGLTYADDKLYYYDWNSGMNSTLSAYSMSGFDDTTDVPEPSIIALFGLGLVGIGFARRRRS